jgi:hypothetical protein
VGRPDFLDTEDGKALLLGVYGIRDPLATTSTERHSPRARSWRDCGRDRMSKLALLVDQFAGIRPSEYTGIN